MRTNSRRRRALTIKQATAVVLLLAAALQCVYRIIQVIDLLN